MKYWLAGYFVRWNLVQCYSYRQPIRFYILFDDLRGKRPTKNANNKLNCELGVRIIIIEFNGIIYRNSLSTNQQIKTQN